MSLAAATFVAALALAQAPVKDPFAGMPGVEVKVPVAGQLEALGAPLEARLWRVKLRPQEAARWVFEAYRRADLYVPPPSKQFQLEGAPQLTGYDDDAQRSYTAIFTDGGDGTTLLVLATADLSQRNAARPPTSLPAVPGAKGALEAKHEGVITLSYGVKATAAEVDEYYRQVLPSAGWKSSDDAWVRGGELLTVQRSDREAGWQGVVVTVRRAGVDQAAGSGR
jgi:hypothetical protein